MTVAEADRIRILAGRLHDYRTERAEREGVAMKLDERWFEAMLRLGAERMFGITWDDEGELSADEPEPEPGFLAAWKRNSTGH